TIWWISLSGQLPVVTRVNTPWPSFRATTVPPVWASRNRSRSPSLSRSTRCSPLSHQLGSSWYFWAMMASMPLEALTLVNVPDGGGAVGVTVSVAAPEVVLPAPLLTTQRNWSPLSAAVVLPRVKLVAVAPLMLTQVAVPLSIFCHWYDS